MRSEIRSNRNPKPLDLIPLQIPHHFRCPISLELMRDPVTIATGQTFDRSSIESWFALSNPTCPVTRSPLSDPTLIPNHTLRRLIQQWCVAHRSHGVERIPTPKQPADPTLILLLLAQASSPDAPNPTRVAALRRLRSLAQDSDNNRALVSSRARSAVAEIAFHANPDLSLEAMACLSALTLTERESSFVAETPARVDTLARMIGSENSVDARIGAASLVEAMRTAEAREAVGAANGIIEGLVELVENGDFRAMRAGMRGLFSLCLAKENRGRAVVAGAAEAVVKRIGEMCCGERGDLERGLATVELLCRVEGGREAVVGVEGAVGDLVRSMEGKATERVAEHAAGALVAVVGGEEELQKEAVAAGVVAHLLVMVQSGCSERARRKAQMLLKLLRPAWSAAETVLFLNSDDFINPV